MADLIYGSNKGGKLRLGQKLGDAFAGALYTVLERPHTVAKIYDPHLAEAQREVLLGKAKAMLARPPAGSGDAAGAVAWPAEILGTREGFAGVLIPLSAPAFAAVSEEVAARRPALRAGVTLEQALKMGSSLAAAVSAVHAAGHLVVNLSPETVLYDRAGEAVLLHTDTFQIAAADGRDYYCVRPPAEYHPDGEAPSDSKSERWRAEHEWFALAVHLFHLLVGTHPFASGTSAGYPDPESPCTLLRMHLFPHALRKYPGLDRRFASAFQKLPPPLRNAFLRAFVFSMAQPEKRPTAAEWHALLRTELGSLRKCQRCGETYSRSQESCPQCS